MAYEVLEPEAKLPGYEVIEPDQAQASQIKQDYISKGGNPRDVLSPERQKIFDDEVSSQLKTGATPQQAALSASQKLDEQQPLRREDGTIAEGYKPTEQAIQDGVIEEKALPAVKLAQSRGIKTVSSGTDKDTGGGFAIGQDQSGNTVRVEVDASGKELPGYDVIEEPTRLGAIARTVASQILPSTTGAIAAETGAALPLPGGLPARLAAGLVAGVGGYIAGQKAQEAAGKALLGPERMARISEVLQRDVEKYPITTTAASLLTPTAGGIATLGRRAIGAFAPKAEEAVVSALPITEKAAQEIGGKVEVPQPAPGMGIRQTPQRIIEEPKFSKQMREDLAKGDIQYQKFSYKEAADNIANQAPEIIDEITRTGSQPEKVVATAVQFNKAVEAGDIEAQKTFAERLGKLATDPAQALNAFKLIKTSTPEGYILGLTQAVSKSGRQLTNDLVSKAKTLFSEKQALQNAFDNLAEKARSTLNDSDIKAAIDAEKKLMDGFYRMQLFESRLLPKKFFGETLPTVIQGNLLAPMSLATNLWSNAINAPLRMASRQVAFATQEIGRAFQKLIGKEVGPRLIAPPTGGIKRTIEVAKAGGRGIAEGLRGLKTGITAEGLLAGEKIRSFQPLQAFKQFWTGEGLAKPIQSGFKGITAQAVDRARLAAETALGVAPETMLRLLQLGDTPFRKIAQARLLAEQAQLAGKTGKALEVATRLPTARQLSKIEEEAAQAVFQQDTMLTKAALNAANLFGAGSKSGLARLAGKSIIPYAKTPVNVLDEMMEFALPPYSLYKSASAARAGDYRKAQMMFGKAVTGTTLLGVAKLLSDEGIISGKPSTSEKIRDVQYQTEAPSTINLSKLQRYANGESTETEPGDKIISLDKLGIVGGILSTMNAANQATKKGSQDAGLEFSALFPETLSFAFNQSFLKGTNSLLSAMLDGSGTTLDKWISDYYGVVASIPLPNTLTAVSRTMRETMPEKFQIKDVPGEGPEKMLNIFGEVIKRRLPSMDEDMPRRIDIWGREVPQTPEGADPVAYNFFDVTKGREVTYDPITLGIYKIFKETDDGDVVPPKPLRNFTLDNVKYRLEPDLYETYARMRGKANRQAAEKVFADNSFKRMKNEDKVIVLRSAYSRVADDVRNEFVSKYANRIRLGERQ